MTTRQLLVKYRTLKITDPSAAFQLFLENEENQRFADLVRTYDNFVQFTEEFIEEGGDIMDRKAYRKYLDKRFEKE